MSENSTIQSILNRRSTRVYLDKQIKDSDLEKIIQAGLYAPSAHNQQPWHFTVIQDKNIIDEISKSTKEELCKFDDTELKKLSSNENFHVLYHAPTVIVISKDKNAPLPEISEVDCAAAVENMLIAAESLGLGTCWIGFVAFLFKSKQIAKFEEILNIPEGYEPFHAVTMGYKRVENTNPPPRRENTVNFV